MPRLIQSNRTSSSGGYFRKKSSTIFQLCAYADGTLFMSKANALCIADYQSHLYQSINKNIFTSTVGPKAL